MSKTSKLKINIEDNNFYRKEVNDCENCEDDEIDLIEKQLENVRDNNKYSSGPNTRKHRKTKRKKDLLEECGNMTEMLAEEIRRISKVSTKNKMNSKSPKDSCGYICSEKNSKNINFKKLFPFVKREKDKKLKKEESSIHETKNKKKMNITQKFDNMRELKYL